jgi:chorismate dehydratase
MSATRLRVGAVNYLNTKPLVYWLDRLAPQAEVVFDLPSRLADELATGHLDVALIPSLEFFQRPDYRIVSDACIACRGPVLSVKLFSRVPAEQIGSLALDEGSRTSVALARVLLHERFGLDPQLEPLPIGASLEDTDADAVLLIGDRAIHSPSPARHGRSSDETGTEAWAEVWDLGDQWCRWSGYPMVFAMWTARVDTELHGLEAALGEARDLGVAHIAQIAAAEAAPLGLTEPQCVGYLRDNLHFYLGPKERQGLRSFYEHCTALGLAPADCKLLGVAPDEPEIRQTNRVTVPQTVMRIRSLEARSNRR